MCREYFPEWCSAELRPRNANSLPPFIFWMLQRQAGEAGLLSASFQLSKPGFGQILFSAVIAAHPESRSSPARNLQFMEELLSWIRKFPVRGVAGSNPAASAAWKVRFVEVQTEELRRGSPAEVRRCRGEG